jgi:hypothetical protein
MDIIFEGPVTNEERAQLSAWTFAHGNLHIRYITVDAGAVVVHGRHPRHHIDRSGRSIRHAGRLNDDLDKAFGRLLNPY